MAMNGWTIASPLYGGDVPLHSGSYFVDATCSVPFDSSTRTVQTNRGFSLTAAPTTLLLTMAGPPVPLADATDDIRLPWVKALDRAGSTNRLPKSIVDATRRPVSTCSPSLLEALGFVQGDGTIRDSMVCCYFTPDKDGEFIETTVTPQLSRIAANPGEDGYEPRSEGSSNTLTFARKRLVTYLDELGFSRAELPKRTLPEFIFSATEAGQRAFLRGLYAANGCVINTTRQAVNLVATSRRLLNQVQLLLLGMGIASSIRIHNREQDIKWSNGWYTSKESYRLEITSQPEINEFARMIGFPQQMQSEKLSTIVSADFASYRKRPEYTHQYVTSVSAATETPVMTVTTSSPTLVVDGLILRGTPAG